MIVRTFGDPDTQAPTAPSVYTPFNLLWFVGGAVAIFELVRFITRPRS